MSFQDDIIKKYTPAQARKQREAFLKAEVKPAIEAVLEKYPLFKSAVVIVSRQEKETGVIVAIGFSIENEPDLKDWFETLKAPLPFEVDPKFPIFVEGKTGALTAGVSFDANGRPDVDAISRDRLNWEPKGEPMALFLGSTPPRHYEDRFSPVAIFRRGNRGALTLEYTGEIVEPDLDGILPLTEIDTVEPEAGKAHREALRALNNRQARREKIKSWTSSFIESPVGKAAKNKLEDWQTPSEPAAPKEPSKPVSDLYILFVIIMLLFLSAIVIAFLQFLGVDIDMLQTTD